MSFLTRVSLIPFASITLLLTGCTLATIAPDAPIPGTPLHGDVHGGTQPVVGAHVYLMAATVSGVGSAGYGLASTSLLNATLTGHSDSIGAYVLTDSLGGFLLDSTSGSTTYFYTCPSSTTQVYLYAVGGNPGAGTNTGASFMAALGSCGNLSSSTYVAVNEVTTIAAAYSLAGFATDALHISIPQYATATQQTNSITDALAQTDLQNAFANVPNLINGTLGFALPITPAGNGTPTTAQLNTVANILAACVDSSGPTSTNCTTLFNNAGSAGGSTGTIPTETATAAINVAHHPYFNSTVLSNLYGLQSAAGAPYLIDDTTQPSDFIVSIAFSGGGLNEPNHIAIDSAGNAWVANGNSISKFSSTGVALSPSSGFTGGGTIAPNYVAVDGTGNVWVTYNYGNVGKFTSTGSLIGGFSGGGIDQPNAIAIDASGNAWIANLNAPDPYSIAYISELSNSGSPISPTGYTGAGKSATAYDIAIDASGNVWATGAGLIEISGNGSPLSPSAGYTGGGNLGQYGIAIDNSGNVWTANLNANTASKFSNSGSPISPSSGYTGVTSPYAIAIDGAGNAWFANYYGGSISYVNYGHTIVELSPSGSLISSTYGASSGQVTWLRSVAIDGSGDVWVANQFQAPISYLNIPGGITVTEFIGAATPVVTPIVANLIAPYSAPASKP